MSRKLKVHNQSMGPNYTQVPTITLKDKWLEIAGFKTGEYVEVEVDGDMIILTKTAVPETKETLDEKIQKLSKSQKEKLSKMIDEL